MSTLPPPLAGSGPYRVCLVCMGNICRSPMAETVLRAALEEAGLGEAVVVDSAGTDAWHVGHPMDERALAELARHGYDGGGHIARRFARAWLSERDLILVMDHDNLEGLLRLSPDPATRDRIRLLRSFDPTAPTGARVNDPYYGGAEGFAEALRDIEAAVTSLVAELTAAVDART